MPFEPIITDRLTLRGLVPADADWIAREIANPNVLQWLTNPPSPYAHSDAVEFIALMENKPGHRVICEGGEPLGVVSIGDHRSVQHELGYWLKESAWGRGIMSEAARAMVDWHWTQTDAPLASGWIVGNAGSAQILSQLGFAPDEKIERWCNYHGREMPLERVKLTKPFKPMFTCKTDRLVLNATTLEDLDVIQREWGRIEVARMMETVIPNWTYDVARDWLVPRLIPSERGFSRAIRLLDGTLIGSVGIGGTPRSMGYLLGPDHWGEGYATEALRALFPAAFAHFPQLEEVKAEVYDDNPASARVLEKIGFEFTGKALCTGKGRVEAAPSSAYRVTRNTLKA